ncbi:MAG: FAD-dependent oxidoreductase, partial [Chloroflexi bacterium]|nr:FAD-dependent oxidoreductase [Chloroflexota bacterium]
MKAEARRPRVVIVGAGFGGLQVARRLSGEPIDVLVVDRHNYHCFLPLLYQVATAGLEPEEIARGVRGILRGQTNLQFRMAEVTGVDVSRKTVATDTGEIAYDYLVLAAGSATNYFGMEEVQRFSYGLKDLNEATELRNHLLTMFERAAI